MKKFYSYKLAAVSIFCFLLTSFLPVAMQGQSWYNISWPYRKAITIDYTKVSSGPHTNFAVLVSITDANLQARALASGNDILFTASDGTTKLNHEIESYTTATGVLVAWVQIPSLSSAANTVIYMYYGNSGAANQQNVTGTWNANYKGVYHLNSGATDATSNANNGTVTGTINYNSAKIAKGGANFVATGGNYITITGLMGSPANVTLSGWGNLTSRDATGAHLVNIGDYTSINVDDATDGYLGAYYNAGWGLTKSSPKLNPAGTGWHYFVYTFTSGTQKLYMDGAVVGSGTWVGSISYSGQGANTRIGKHANGSNNFDFAGTIDEVRISNSVRSTGWILTEYNNQNSPSTFYSVGSEQMPNRFTGTGNFSTAARWTNSVVPVAGDNVLIDGNCTVDNNATYDNVAYGALVVGYTAAGTLNWTSSGTNTLNVTNVSAMYSTGSIDMTNGGTLKINGSVTSTSLTFTPGTGTVNVLSTTTLPAAYTSYNNLTITGSVTLGVATSITGNFTNNGTFTHSNLGVTFSGTANQTIGGSNSTTFYNLTLNNTGISGSDVITLSKAITVSNTLTLTDGILATDATNLLTLTNSSTTATTRGNSSGPSFVKGPIRWNGLNGAGPFIFPTGVGTSGWANVAVSGVTSATDFTAQYFNTAYTNVSSAYLSTAVTPSLTTVSHVEYWDVARTSGTGNAAVTLYWKDASTSYINSCASNGNLKVAHFNTGTNKWENANSSGTVVVTGSCSGSSSGTVKSDVMTSFSPFTFGSGSSGVNPLPIELLNFNAVFNGTTTDISWQTASEINNNYFTVERSTDGINYTTLSTITSKALNGNSTSVLSYTLNDPNTVTGVYYYRLKQTDFDFKYTYSNVVVVTVTKNVDFTFDLAPNPNDGNSMQGFIATPHDGMATFKIYNTAGNRLYMEDIQVKEGENNPFKIQFKDRLDVGTYIVIVMLNDDLTQKKLMMVTR